MIQSAFNEASFDVNEQLNRLSHLVETTSFEAAEQLLGALDSASRTVVLSRLPEQLRQQLLTGIDPEHAAAYLHHLPEVQAVELLGDIAPAVPIFLKSYPKANKPILLGNYRSVRWILFYRRCLLLTHLRCGRWRNTKTKKPAES